MRKWRRKYYDLFSNFYDHFVALHSSDKRGNLRACLARQTQAAAGDRVLDICTGTGSVLRHLAQRVESQGLVVGLDFSIGMLKAAKEKNSGLGNVYLVQAEASAIPFKPGVFRAVTCSHAFYELKGLDQDRCLEEVKRVLGPVGSFLMMEHATPKKSFIRMLYYVRLMSMGASKAIQILKHEKAYFRGYFGSVKSVDLPGGMSKVLICGRAAVPDQPRT